MGCRLTANKLITNTMKHHFNWNRTETTTILPAVACQLTSTKGTSSNRRLKVNNIFPWDLFYAVFFRKLHYRVVWAAVSKTRRHWASLISSDDIVSICTSAVAVHLFSIPFDWWSVGTERFLGFDYFVMSSFEWWKVSWPRFSCHVKIPLMLFTSSF